MVKGGGGGWDARVGPSERLFGELVELVELLIHAGLVRSRPRPCTIGAAVCFGSSDSDCRCFCCCGAGLEVAAVSTGMGEGVIRCALSGDTFSLDDAPFLVCWFVFVDVAVLAVFSVWSGLLLRCLFLLL